MALSKPDLIPAPCSFPHGDSVPLHLMFPDGEAEVRVCKEITQLSYTPDRKTQPTHVQVEVHLYMVPCHPLPFRVQRSLILQLFPALSLMSAISNFKGDPAGMGR